MRSQYFTGKTAVHFAKMGEYLANEYHIEESINSSIIRRRRNRPVNILMIDDHPSQIEGYKVILAYNKMDLPILTTSCYNLESAYRIITTGKASNVDIVFLDRSLPEYADQNLYTGEDLALIIQKHMPSTKIVMLTSHSETFLLYNIVKKIDPAGLLVKSDFTAEDLLHAFSVIMNGQTYHSETVKRSIRELLSKEEYLDSLNRQIILLLAKGVMTKNLPDYLHMSLSSIEKRKSLIKDYLGIEKGSDEDIVREARKLGFI